MSSSILDPRHVSSVSFDMAARGGRIPGLSKESALGHSDDVNTNLRCLYHGMGTSGIYTNVQSLIETPAEVFIASESANDASAGSGARTVLIVGLDANLDVAQTIATLNGQTAVSIGTWAAVRKMQVLTAGATGSNEGEIWLGTGVFTAGAPANHLNAMEPGTNVAVTALMVVPADHKWYVDQFTIYSGDTTKTLNFQFWQYSYTTGLWYEVFDIHGKQDSEAPDVRSYPPLSGGDAVMLRCAVDTGTAKVTGSIGGFLVKND